jgi:hypothetical protein
MNTSKRKSWRNYIFPIFAFLFAIGSFIALQGVDEGLIPWFHDRYLGEEWFQPEMLWQYGSHGVLVGLLFGGSLVSLLWKAHLKPLVLQFYTVGHIVFITIGIITYDTMLTMPVVLIMFTVVNLILISTYVKPRDLFKMHLSEKANKPLLYLTIAAALVLLPQIWEGLRLQWIQVDGEFRWGEMAVMYIALIMAGFGGAIGKNGARVLTVLTSLAYLYLAILSFSIPGYAGSWGYLGGGLSLMMSAGYFYFGKKKTLPSRADSELSIS